ncbi:GAF domain-containing protein [Pedobacter sp. SD-b]|uniref:histidine kinase n=1 Tax=Pedobacter segetis TaxID=2793069 RepID=A0ABS1BFI6_9SPHI|nr:GAF domain-containing protein [Pedobacter segetis]MBK0381618.1 GAF domain-containing protein [Pedobacter segetis]
MIENNELERLKAVGKYLMFDVKKEVGQIAKLASVLTKKPIALVTLIDESEQIILAGEGIDLDRMPRATSFCAQAIKENDVLVVEDATEDERFKNLPSVTGEFNIRFYASANLNSNDGYKIGTLCVYDIKPSQFSDEEKGYLRILAAQVDHVLELNRQLSLSVKKNQTLAQVAWVHSHQFRGPLTSVLGMIDLIKLDNYKFNKEYIDLLEKSANQLDKVINQIIRDTSN